MNAPTGSLGMDEEATRVQGGGAAPVPGGAGVLERGTRLGEFEITGLVGQGGFGVVYEAWDHVLERTVAIKEYLPASLSTRHADGTVAPLSQKHRETFELGMRSFINEARLLARFDHPSLLKVYRFWEERGTTYLVMPLYRGQTLRQALAAEPRVQEEWLLRMADGVSQALAVMHGAQCFHRDIAPDNIMLLEGSGLPVVLDFGAARRVISDRTQAITVILKPGYAPVEQYAEMPDMQQGPWTDVYALAAVLHMAVCGKPPMPSVARMLSDSHAPLAGNEALRQRFSARLLQAIDRGLAVRPEQRPQSMAELRALLGLDGVPPAQAPPPVPAEPTIVLARPSPGSGRASGARLWIGGLAAAAALAAAGSLWLWMQPAPRPDTGPAPIEPATAPRPAPPEQAPQPVASPPAAPLPRTPLQSLQALAQHAAADFAVSAQPLKPTVRIGKDGLEFELRSQRDGYAYVYLLSTDGQMLLLFPNQLDRHNRIAAAQTLRLPRAAWPMNAAGPAGRDEFAVVVSASERDFSESGAQSDGMFTQFAPPVLAALEAASAAGPSPLLGKAVCPAGGGCDTAYGVAYFSVTEE